MPSRKAPKTSAAKAQEDAKPPEGRRPWEDRSLSSKERYDSYKTVLKEHLVGVIAVLKRDGILEHERKAILDNLEAKRWGSEAEQLDSETPEQFCYRIDEGIPRELLGKNFLGAAAWQQGFKVDVGAEPPLPATITKALLESECPLHPGQLIKDTHLLVLMPKTVDGKPYSALELDRLCAGKKGSGSKLIDGDFEAWKSQYWVFTPQAQSEWVLIPKSDPDPKKLHPKKGHFRSKSIAAQDEVLAGYPEYREAKVVEVMTAALLNDLVRGAPRMLPNSCLRCKEPGTSGWRVSVGNFFANGLGVLGDSISDVYGLADMGRALARK